METKDQIDLTKSVDELNNVINTEEQKEEDKTVSMLAKAMEKLGFKGSNDVDLVKSQAAQAKSTDSNEATGDSKEEEEEDADDNLNRPSIDDVESGADASEFVEKAIEYMGGVHDLVKSLKDELITIKKDNSDLKKSLVDSNYALGALVNSQTELHKSLKATGIELITPMTREAVVPSQAAQTLQKGTEEDINFDLGKQVKDCFDDAEVNILAKAMQDNLVTTEEVAEAKRTFVLPKRLLS